METNNIRFVYTNEINIIEPKGEFTLLYSNVPIVPM
jgi:hypothetical protein